MCAITEIIEATAACWMDEFHERIVDTEWSGEAWVLLSTAEQNRIGSWDEFHARLQDAVAVLYSQTCQHG